MQIFDYDYFTDRPNPRQGLTRIARLIRQARAEAANTLFFDNGDILQGNPAGDWLAENGEPWPGDIHPMVEAMNLLGLDAATLGNHDFNYGLDFLEKALSARDYPVVLANVALAAGAEPTQDRTLFPPYALLRRTVVDGAGQQQALTIGVIGVTPPQIVKWDRDHLEGRVVTRDIVATARAYVPRMRQEGADIVVALCHSGIEPANADTTGLEHASVPLAAIPGVDAVLAGHSHLVFPGPDHAAADGIDPVRGRLHGKPAVMAGFWGSHLGVVDLFLEHDGTGWRVSDSRTEARPVARAPAAPEPGQDDPALDREMEPLHRRTLDHIRRPLGRSEVPMHSYFALFSGSRALATVAEAKIAHVRTALAHTSDARLPVLAAVSPYKAGGRAGPLFYTDIPPGPLAIRSVADLYFYPNAVRAVRLTGAELRDWLERSASIFRRVAPGAEDAPLRDTGFPSYHFDVIFGAEYEIDLSQPPGYDARGLQRPEAPKRIRNLRIAGRPVTDTTQVIVATNSYRLAGSGAYAGASFGTLALGGRLTSREVLARHLLDAGTIAPEIPRNWSFVPMPATTVTVETGPGARPHLGELDGWIAEDLGETDAGFVQLRLSLGEPAA